MILIRTRTNFRSLSSRLLVIRVLYYFSVKRTSYSMPLQVVPIQISYCFISVLLKTYNKSSLIKIFCDNIRNADLRNHIRMYFLRTHLFRYRFQYQVQPWMLDSIWDLVSYGNRIWTKWKVLTKSAEVCPKCSGELRLYSEHSTLIMRNFIRRHSMKIWI